MKFDEAALEELVSAIRDSAKYRYLSPDLIRRLGRKELQNRPSLKTAIHETRSRLHQSAGAYLDSTPNYARWLKELDAAASLEDVKALALQWMRSHASTRERIESLEEIYSTILPSIGPIQSVIDIACGINPLALPWMGLATNVNYAAYDLYSDMMDFLSAYFIRLGVHSSASACDAAVTPPQTETDLAIILKFLPVVEQNERGSTLKWLQQLNAKHLLISYPTGSLGGRSKGMAQNYEARFLEAISPTEWQVERFLFATELCFLVHTNLSA